MSTWKSPRTCRDTGQRTSSAPERWWCGEEPRSGLVCNWGADLSIPWPTSWGSKLCSVIYICIFLERCLCWLPSPIFFSTSVLNCFTWLSFFPTGHLYVLMPVTFSKRPSPSSYWKAYIDPERLNLWNPSIFILPPASASVGYYRFRLSVLDEGNWQAGTYRRFVLLCNPWCSGESPS